MIYRIPPLPSPQGTRPMRSHFAGSISPTITCKQAFSGVYIEHSLVYRSRVWRNLRSDLTLEKIQTELLSRAQISHGHTEREREIWARCKESLSRTGKCAKLVSNWFCLFRLDRAPQHYFLSPCSHISHNLGLSKKNRMFWGTFRNFRDISRVLRYLEI